MRVNQSHIQPPTRTTTASSTNALNARSSNNHNLNHSNNQFASFQLQQMGHLNTMNRMNPMNGMIANNNCNVSVPSLTNLPKFPTIPSLPNISSLPSINANQTQQTVSFINNCNAPNTTNMQTQPQILVPIGNMNGSLNNLNNLNLNLRSNNYYQRSAFCPSSNYATQFSTVHNQQFQPLPPSTVILQTNANNPHSNAAPASIQNINHTTHNHHNHNNNVIAFINNNNNANQSQTPQQQQQQQQRNQISAHIACALRDDKKIIKVMDKQAQAIKNVQIQAKKITAPTKMAAKPTNIPRFIENNQANKCKKAYVVKFKSEEKSNEFFISNLRNMKNVIFCDFLCEEKMDKTSNCAGINGQLHKCSKCDKKYKYLCNLRSHSKVHTNEAHVCEYCQKRFGRKANYQEHRRVHTGESPYSCSTCKRSFKQRHGLKDHMRLRCTPNK